MIEINLYQSCTLGINIKNTDAGKSKINQLRRPKTGGGPAPPPLTEYEDALMQAFDGRQQICGLSDGIDTDAIDTDTIDGNFNNILKLGL